MVDTRFDFWVTLDLSPALFTLLFPLSVDTSAENGTSRVVSLQFAGEELELCALPSEGNEADQPNLSSSWHSWPPPSPFPSYNTYPLHPQSPPPNSCG